MRTVIFHKRRFAHHTSLATGATLTLAALVGAFASAQAFAQDSEQPTVLKKIVVEGNSSTSEAKDNDTVVPEQAESALKSDAPLSRTPRSVAVITHKEMEERAVTDMIQAVRYSAGAGTGQFGYDPRFDQITLRGYDTVMTGDFRDGLRQPYMNYATFPTETYGLDRIEVVKGPVSVLYGASSVAGIINRVSKFADGLHHGEVETQYGSYGRKQVAFDIGDVSTSNDAVSWRLVALARDGDTSYDSADNRLLLMPSVQWAPDEATSLTVYAIGQKYETDTNVQTFRHNGNILRYSDPDYDYQKTEQVQTGYKFEHEFDNGVKVSQHARYSYLDLKSRYLDMNSLDSATGLMTRYPVAITDRMNVFQVDNRVTKTVDSGPLEHNLTGGLDYTYINSSFGLGYGDVDSAYNLDINNPRYGVSGSTPAITERTGLDRLQVGAYAQDQINYDNWAGVLGVRRDWVHQTATDDLTNTTTGDDRDGAWSYQTGLLYHFDSGLAPYVNYATSFVPQSTLDADGNMLTPMTGKQFEAGVKFRPDGADYAINLAYYHMVQANASTYAGYNKKVGYYYRAIGEVTTDGVEVEARKEFSNGFSLISAYNYNDAEITKSSTAAEIGNKPSTTPLHTASLWVNYTVPDEQILDGLSGGAGIRYNSSSFKDTLNSAKNGKAVYLDAAISFDLGKQFRKADGLKASFSVNNILDKRQQVCTDGYCYTGQGRTILGSLKYSW
jgi:iron complex outermembrane receptor protein